MIIAYDLAHTHRACIATHNAITLKPCPHGCTTQCPEVVEQCVFVTTSLETLRAELDRDEPAAGSPGGD